METFAVLIDFCNLAPYAMICDDQHETCGVSSDKFLK